MSDPPISAPPLRAGRLALFFALFLAILGAKFLLIDRYGSDLPFWDQWDGEGEFLLRPYLEDRLTAHEWFRPHNEHRPVLTRVLSLALLEVGGRQWDARVQLLVNAVLHAALALLLLRLAWRALPPFATVAFAGVTALFFATSVSWENTLAGFQSQFYFVLLCSALHLGGTLLAPARSWRWWLAPLAGAAALFCMASGLLSALAILGAVIARALRDRKLTRDDLFVLGINVPLVVAGLLLKADVPGHAVLKATTLTVWLDAFLHQFSWPVMSLWAAPFGLLPPAAVALAYFRRRIDGPVALTLLAACTWFCLQAAAIAYARGADGHGYASRYCDTLVVGLLVNLLSLAYLATTAPSARARLSWLGGAVLFTGVAVWGLSRETVATYENTLRDMPRINQTRIDIVRGYVLQKDPAFFNKEPWSELPYPSAHRLAGLLDTPSLRAALPASVRPPLSLSPDPAASQGFDDHSASAAPGPPPLGLVAWRSQPGTAGRFSSALFLVERSRLSLFVAGDNAPDAHLRLIDERGRAHEPLGPLTLAPRWKRLNFTVAPGRYRLEAAHAGAGWLAFTQPIGNSAASALAPKVARLGPWLLGTSVLLGLAAVVLLRPPASAVVASRRDFWSALAALTLGLAVSAVLLGRLGVIPTTSRSGPPILSGRPAPNFALADPARPLLPDRRFADAAFLLPDNTQTWFGTYVSGDSFTGRVLSTEFTLDGSGLRVPILGYPSSPGNELALEVLDAARRPVTVIVFRNANPRESPGIWELPVAEWRGRTARLRLVDGQTAPGGWLAVGPPLRGDFAGLASLDGVERNYGWFVISALAWAALLFLPGLALRTWRPQFLPRGAVFLALPGLFLLVAGGLLLWVGGPAPLQLPAGVWLAAHAVLAGALLVRWWHRGGPLDSGEAASLGVYGCVAVSALAFGVLPLDVAQEFNPQSSAHSRMIASPPDHAIPHRTAIYFYHQKNGREDRALYFGDDWSVASRGPLLPLAIGSAFVLWSERPSDPPGYSLEKWPAPRDAFFLARIGGILLNALVVLAGATLAARLAPAAGRVALVWLAVSPVVTINTDFLWPKLLATFFVALAVLATLERRSPGRVALWSALAYFSHPVGGLFAPPLLLFLAHRSWAAASGSTGARAGCALRDGAAFCGVLLACLAPWFAFKAWVGHPDVFLNYPLGDGRGLEHAASVTTWLRCRWDNLWLTVVPGAFHFSDRMYSWVEGAISEPLRWAIGYAKTLPGALGFASFAIAGFALVRPSSPVPFGFRRHLLFGSFVLMLLFWGYSRDGFGRNCLEPLAVLLIVYAAAAMPAGWRPWRWLLLGTALEGLGVRLVGVIYARSFSPTHLDVESVALTAICLLATVAPAVWFFATSPRMTIPRQVPAADQPRL